MNTPGKYDAIVADALRLGEPVARAMRRAGFSAQAIRSCQGMLAQIKQRVAPVNEAAWNYRKRRCFIANRCKVMERLEKGTSKNEAGDVQLIEAYDRALDSMKKKEKCVPVDAPGPPQIEPDVPIIMP